MRNLLTVVLLLFTFQIYAQDQTVGLFTNDTASLNGYTLFAPIFSYETFLIDNCGQKVHSWVSDHQTGHSCYLLENGVLLRAGRKGDITSSKGIVEMFDWDGNVIWSYSLPESVGRQHHDIEMLPNGNILLIVWDAITPEEVIQAGSSTTEPFINSEKIIEIQPDIENDTAIIVWEWRIWDHLIQDVDTTKDNFGVIADHPERIDINFLGLNTNDPFHANAVDYNAEFDQIVFSPRSFSELWIIDHSTTTAEAASSSGGTYGKGGDLLYRWGNPQVYDQGTEADQILFLQHNTNWIEEGFPDAGKIMVFNNRAGTLEERDYSAVHMINTPVDANGFYTYNGGAYGPTEAEWTYTAPEPTDFYSNIVSGAERLENGNTLICEGTSGHFFEVDERDSIVWDYVSPINSGGALNQGDEPSGTIVFRATKYPANYPGLDGQTLEPMGYLESGSTFSCELFPEIITTVNQNLNSIEFDVYPNPANNFLKIRFNSTLSADAFKNIKIYNAIGSIAYSSDEIKDQIDVSLLANGIYFVKMDFGNMVLTKKIIME